MSQSPAATAVAPGTLPKFRLRPARSAGSLARSTGSFPGQFLVEIDPTVMPVTHLDAESDERPSIGGARGPRRDAAPEPNGGVGHARELLAQGADTLANLRRPVH